MRRGDDRVGRTHWFLAASPQPVKWRIAGGGSLTPQLPTSLLTYSESCYFSFMSPFRSLHTIYCLKEIPSNNLTSTIRHFASCDYVRLSMIDI